MSTFSWREFRPTILFLVKFLAMYLVGNLIYGFYVTAYLPESDPLTRWATIHSAFLLNVFDFPVAVHLHTDHPTTSLLMDGQVIISVYEGCNGLNTMIIFISFLFAFGPVNRSLVWFSVLGLGTIHLANLGRIVVLFLVSGYLPEFMYFTHKYFFTAVLYVIVFVFWIVWVRRFSAGRIVAQSERK